MKVAFHPHIVGYGHRVRCNLIAKEIRRLNEKAKIVFLERVDDPLYRENWTSFKRVHGGFRRSLSIFTSSCLVEDCTIIEDFRRRWYSRIGKIVTILNPTFGPDFEEHKHNLAYNDSIIICYPKDFYPFPKMLEEFREKVEWYGPVLNLPYDDFHHVTSERTKMNLLLSRGRERVLPLIEELSKNLDFDIIRTEFKSDEDYFGALAETTIAITQGTTAVFECSQLGIPQICLPINEEQLVVAKRFEEAGGLSYLPIEEATKDSLGSILSETIFDENMRQEMARKAKDFSATPGTSDIAQAILRLVKGVG